MRKGGQRTPRPAGQARSSRVSSLWQRTRQGPYRWPLRLAVVLAAGLAAFVWFARQRAEQHLTVENRSGRPIPELQVTVAGQSTTFRDVASGAQVSSPSAVPAV